MIFVPLVTGAEWCWFKQRTHIKATEDSQGLVVYRDDEIQAMAVFDSFSPSSVNVHWAIDNPMVLKHGFFEEICRHAFVAHGKQRIFGLIPSDNVKSLHLSEHIGMVEVARVPDAMGMGVDYVIMCMKREACRYLPVEVREAA